MDNRVPRAAGIKDAGDYIYLVLDVTTQDGEHVDVVRCQKIDIHCGTSTVRQDVDRLRQMIATEPVLSLGYQILGGGVISATATHEMLLAGSLPGLAPELDRDKTVALLRETYPNWVVEVQSPSAYQAGGYI